SFILIADNVTNANKDRILEDNQHVLTARLDDVAFFWKEDAKKPLMDRVSDLKKVLFQDGIGSIYQKLERHQKIATFILEQLNNDKVSKASLGSKIEPDKLTQAIWLSKSDLTTEMVFELPVLQGKMGYEYAIKEGVSQEIAESIEQHYWPKFEGDTVPDNPYSVISAMVDKIDTIVSCFYNNLIPTGSQDPWGIRRHVFGVYSIIEKHKLNLNVKDLIDFAYGNFDKGEVNRVKLDAFVEQRIKSFMGTRNYSYDVIDSVMESMWTYPLTGFSWAEFLMDKKGDSSLDALKSIIETSARIKNLSKKANDNGAKLGYDETLFKQEEEKDAKIKIDWFLKSVDINDISAAYDGFLEIIPIFVRYFEKVMVMDEDSSVRMNRLGFLQSVDISVLSRFPDLNKLSIPK
ncbi:glycine--tRNA ligase subunit beta, partial [bacterium]|nr:glycine--tRNA ligase subunit beta [bacterium]